MSESALDLYYEEQMKLLASPQPLSDEKKTKKEKKKTTASKGKTAREPKLDANGERIVSSSKKRKREAEGEGIRIEDANLAKEADLSSTKNPKATKKAKVKKTPSTFFGQTSLIMHAMGDGPSPLEDAVKKVEADAISYTIKLLQDLRLLSGKSTTSGRAGTSTNITIKDFASHIPETTRVYFRWKAMKGLAKTEPVEVSGKGVTTQDGAINDNDAVNDNDDDFTGEGGDNNIQSKTILNKDEEDEVDGYLPPEDAEEQQQLAQLEEEATSRLIEDDQGSSNNTALADLSPAIIAFKRRLAFQNSRSRLMTTAQYSRYKDSRESSFTNGKGALMKKFSELFPLPRLTKASLDVLAFLAYDRVGTIVEYAVRAYEASKNSSSSSSSSSSTANDGRQMTVNSDELLVADYSMLEGQLPLSAYEAAFSGVPSGPLELTEVLDDLWERVNAQQVSQQLKLAREAQNAARNIKKDQSMIEAVHEESSAVGGHNTKSDEPLHDVEGDAAFLAFML